MEIIHYPTLKLFGISISLPHCHIYSTNCLMHNKFEHRTNKLSLEIAWQNLLGRISNKKM